MSNIVLFLYLLLSLMHKKDGLHKYIHMSNIVFFQGLFTGQKFIPSFLLDYFHSYIVEIKNTLFFFLSMKNYKVIQLRMSFILKTKKSYQDHCRQAQKKSASPVGVPVIQAGSFRVSMVGNQTHNWQANTNNWPMSQPEQLGGWSAKWQAG